MLSSLHQCSKFIINGLEYCIKYDLKTFIIHEVGIYEDPSYFFPFNQDLFAPYMPKKENEKEIKKSRKNYEKGKRRRG